MVPIKEIAEKLKDNPDVISIISPDQGIIFHKSGRCIGFCKAKDLKKTKDALDAFFGKDGLYSKLQ